MEHDGIESLFNVAEEYDTDNENTATFFKSKKGNNESSKDTESQSSVDEQAKNMLKTNITKHQMIRIPPK